MFTHRKPRCRVRLSTLFSANEKRKTGSREYSSYSSASQAVVNHGYRSFDQIVVRRTYNDAICWPILDGVHHGVCDVWDQCRDSLSRCLLTRQRLPLVLLDVAVDSVRTACCK